MDSSIIIAPNPAAILSNIYLPKDIPYATLALYTAIGQPVLHQRLTTGWNTVPLEGIVPGLYFYEVKDEERVLKSSKLVKVEQ